MRFEPEYFDSCRDCDEKSTPRHLDIFGRCEECAEKYEKKQDLRKVLAERFKDILEEWDLPRDGYGVLAEKLVDEVLRMEEIHVEDS